MLYQVKPIQDDNKAFLEFRSEPLFIHTVRALIESTTVGSVVIVGPKERLERALAQAHLGGNTSILVAEQGQNIIGVFEIYSDVTPRLEQIERKQYEVSTMVLAILSLPYLVLLLFVTRADRILSRQQREHKQATDLSTRLGRLLDRSANEIYVFDATSLKFTHVNRGACKWN